MRRRMALWVALIAASVPIAAATAQESEPWPEAAFGEPEVYSTGEEADADSVALGDVTGDGLPDAVVATGRTAYQLVVFAQRPDRSLAEAARLPLRSGHPTELYPGEPVAALGDLDGDRDLDAAATGNTSVYHQRDGALHGPQDIGIGTTLSLELADMDADGLADLVVLPPSGGMSVYRRTKSDSTYRGGPIEIADGSQPGPGEEIEVGDVNSDGRLDIVTFGEHTIQLYEARADGTYSMRVIELPTDGSVDGIEVADLTGDGAADVAASFGNWARVLPQRDGAISDTGPDYLSHYYPRPLEAADMNGDGRLDLVAVDVYYTELGIWPQLFDGTLGEQGTVALPKGSSTFDPKGLALGDIDCDGRVDAAVADFTLGLVVARQTFSGSADCPDPPVPPAEPPPPPPPPVAPTGPPPRAPDLEVSRRQDARVARKRGVRARVVVPAGCRASVALRSRRGRRLARRRVAEPGSQTIRLKTERRLWRGAQLRVRATFSCGEAGTHRRSRRVTLV